MNNNNKKKKVTNAVNVLLPSYYVADPRKPEGVPFKPKVTAMVGTNATLECRFAGFPQPEITWSRNGQELKYSLGQKIVGSNDTYRATYTIANVKFNDTDDYVCLGENPHGKLQMKVNLLVQGTSTNMHL